MDKKKELAMTKRSLSELDGFSTKLEQLKRQLKEKDDKLAKLKEETDVNELSQEITEKSSKVQSLDKEVKNLKVELSVLETQKETASQLAMKKNDFNEKKEKMKKILNKSDDDFETIFPNGRPDIDDLKREFKIKDQAVSSKKAELEQKIMTGRTKLENENLSIQVRIEMFFQFN